MTNKQMPKVGERYKQKKTNKIFNLNHLKAKYWLYDSDNSDNLILKEEIDKGSTMFFDDFEPLPNPESKEKLPEVGREYRNKMFPSLKQKVSDIDTLYSTKTLYIIFESGDTCQADLFWDKWDNLEEIPSTNQQEESEVQVKESMLSDEVKEAMEGLKKELSQGVFFKDLNIAANYYCDLAERSKNLLNALESMGESNIPEKKIPTMENHAEQYKKMLEEGDVVLTAEGYKYYCCGELLPKKGDCGICENCGKEFKISESLVVCVKRFCSEKCAILYNNQVEEEKEICSCGNKDCVYETYEKDGVGGPISRSHYKDLQKVLEEDRQEMFKENNKDVKFKIPDLRGFFTKGNPIEEEKEGEEEKEYLDRLFGEKGGHNILPYGECKVESIEGFHKSIWKHVSELPQQIEHVFIRFDDTEVLLGKYDPDAEEYGVKGLWYNLSKSRESALNAGRIKYWVSITDFINAFEDLQERVRKLENK